MGHGAESAAMLAELQAYKEAERAERGRRSTLYIRPEDNGFEPEQEDVNPFALVTRDEGAPPDLIKEIKQAGGAHHDGATFNLCMYTLGKSLIVARCVNN